MGGAKLGDRKGIRLERSRVPFHYLYYAISRLYAPILLCRLFKVDVARNSNRGRHPIILIS